MEYMDSEQLIKDFEDAMVNINEYSEAVNEKIELFEEKVVDLKADLWKSLRNYNLFLSNY